MLLTLKRTKTHFPETRARKGVPSGPEIILPDPRICSVHSSPVFQQKRAMNVHNLHMRVILSEASAIGYDTPPPSSGAKQLTLVCNVVGILKLLQHSAQHALARRDGRLRYFLKALSPPCK